MHMNSSQSCVTLELGMQNIACVGVCCPLIEPVWTHRSTHADLHALSQPVKSIPAHRLVYSLDRVQWEKLILFRGCRPAVLLRGMHCLSSYRPLIRPLINEEIDIFQKMGRPTC